MKRIKQPDQRVEKATALKTLSEIKNPCTLDDFAAELGNLKFRMNGDNRAYNILHRLSKDGLVKQTQEGKKLVEYQLRTRNGQIRTVRRLQSHTNWTITAKGRAQIPL